MNDIYSEFRSLYESSDKIKIKLRQLESRIQELSEEEQKVFKELLKLASWLDVDLVLISAKHYQTEKYDRPLISLGKENNNPPSPFDIY